ncbi:MAG: metal-sulfur cluster assembly factor [Candidatus Dormibacteria bacterium]
MTDPNESTPNELSTAQASPIPLSASEELVYDALRNIYDPELGIDIVSLGLVYGVTLDENGTLVVDMTLTSPYCPLGDIIEVQAQSICSSLPGVNQTIINFVWTPPWDPRTMASDEAKLDLGIY